MIESENPDIDVNEIMAKIKAEIQSRKTFDPKQAAGTKAMKAKRPFLLI